VVAMRHPALVLQGGQHPWAFSSSVYNNIICHRVVLTRRLLFAQGATASV
jgi:hypothetical protein